MSPTRRQAGKDPKEAERLSKRAGAKAEKHAGALKEVLDDLQALIRLIKAYAKGDYRGIPWATVVLATASVIYFVWPLDVIPDVIPGVGLSDDVLVALFVLGAIRSDLDDFRGWESETKASPSKPKHDPKPRSGAAATSRKPGSKPRSEAARKGRKKAARKTTARS